MRPRPSLAGQLSREKNDIHFDDIVPARPDDQVCMRIEDLIDISAANPEPAMVPANSPSEILPTTCRRRRRLLLEGAVVSWFGCLRPRRCAYGQRT